MVVAVLLCCCAAVLLDRPRSRLKTMSALAVRQETRRLLKYRVAHAEPPHVGPEIVRAKQRENEKALLRSRRRTNLQDGKNSCATSLS